MLRQKLYASLSSKVNHLDQCYDIARHKLQVNHSPLRLWRDNTLTAVPSSAMVVGEARVLPPERPQIPADKCSSSALQI